MRTCFQTFLFVLTTAIVNGQDRKITPQLHPGCDFCTEDDILMYIKAEGSNDTIHQIWDFTRGIPTVILAVAGKNSTLDIKWIGKTPNRFELSEEPTYSFATAIDKLYEYDDVHDNGYIDNKSPKRTVPLQHTQWTLLSIIQTPDQVMVDARGLVTYKRISGIIDVKLNFLPYKDSAVELPHLIHTSDSALMDVSLVNFTNEYNATRYAVHATLVSTDLDRGGMHYAMRKSLDDEHTPGVFEIVEIKSPASYGDGRGGYVQFRPVAYTARARSVATSTYVHVAPLNWTKIPERSTLETFYRAFDPRSLLVQDMSVSFGDSGDGYYKQHNFTAWSLTVGYGSPPVEGFSTFVIVIICIGLGVPVLLAVSGAVYAVLRRARSRDAHSRLTNDD